MVGRFGSVHSALDAHAARTAAQRALFRILETTIPERETWTFALGHALSAAACESLPEDFDDLIAFVRAHLVPRLDDDQRPWIVAALLEDLEAEAELARLGDGAWSSARMAVATRVPDRLPETQPAPPEAPETAGDLPPNPAPRLEALLAQALSSNPSPRPHTPSEPASGCHAVAGAHAHAADGASSGSFPTKPPHRDLRHARQPRRIDRPAVVVVDRDRFGRTALARALVQDRCDVTVLDDVDAARAHLRSNQPIDALVIDVDCDHAPELLAEIAERHAEVAVLVRTNATPAVAQHVLGVARLPHAAVFARSGRTAELIVALRGLVDR